MKKLIAAFIIFLGSVGYAADLMRVGPEKTMAFYSATDKTGWKVVVRGQILAFGVDEQNAKDNLSGNVHRKSQVTVRLFNNEGIKVHDELFVIDKNNLITGRIKVNSVYKSSSFGYMLIGSGNFIMCDEKDRVVQRAEEKFSHYAVVHKGRGDYFAEKGDDGSAMAQYKKALDLDKNNPEVHLAMGELYYRQGVLQYAYKEFSEAKKSIVRLYDNEDKYTLHKYMAQIRLREILEVPMTAEKREAFRNQGIEHGKDALTIYSTSADVNYIMGRFHYKKSMIPEDEDTIARDYFLKVVEVQKEHVGANIALAELYLKHKNREKAEFYILQALKGEPRNARAREILTNINAPN